MLNVKHYTETQLCNSQHSVNVSTTLLLSPLEYFKAILRHDIVYT